MKIITEHAYTSIHFRHIPYMNIYMYSIALVQIFTCSSCSSIQISISMPDQSVKSMFRSTSFIFTEIQ